MSKNLTDLNAGDYFTYLGVQYQFLRITGEVDMLNRNQWGRATGGTHPAIRAAVKVNKRHRGWQFSYVGFRVGTVVQPLDPADFY